MVSKPDSVLTNSGQLENNQSKGFFVLLGSAALGFVEPLIREAVAKSEKIAKRKTKARQKTRGTR